LSNGKHGSRKKPQQPQSPAIGPHDHKDLTVPAESVAPLADGVKELKKALTAHQNENNPYERKQLRVQWLLCIFSGFGLLAAGYYAYVAHEQSQEQRNLDQRPWVSVIAAVPKDLKEDESGTFSFRDFSVTVRNSGKTPAVNVSGKYLMIVWQNLNDPIPDYDAALKESQLPAKSRTRGHKFSLVDLAQPLRGGIIAPNEERQISFWPILKNIEFKNQVK
jgi:hypothetical protein